MRLPLPPFLNLPGAPAVALGDPRAAIAEAARLHLSGHLGAAAERYRGILALDPGQPTASILVALAEARLGRAPAAAAALAALSARRPDDGLAIAALGAVRLAAGDATGADSALRQAATLCPGDVQVWHLLGVLALLRQDRTGAEDHLRRALAGDPALLVARLLLVVLLTRLGRLEEAATLLQGAEVPAPQGDPLHDVWRAFAPEDTYLEAGRELALALSKRGRAEDGVVVCQVMAGLYPGQGRRHYDLGIALEEAGEIEPALAAYREAVRLSPRAYPPHAKVGSMLLFLGRPQEAIAACRDCLATRPGHAHALGHMAVALDELGERAAAARLLDLERFVRPRQFREEETPGGLARLNADLRRALLEGADLKRLGNWVLTRGIDIDDIFPATRDPFDRLEALIRTGIGEYMAALPADSDHPYLASRPRRWWLKAWGTVLESGGWQAAHLHMEGWMSGTYYVAVPEQVRSQPGSAGHLMFGRPPERMPLHAHRRLMTVRPNEGLTVMFPSYVFHQTVPFESAAPRMTISYDLRPAD